jgi:hypothetical protein
MATKNAKTLEKDFKSKAVLEKTITQLREKNKALEETVSKLLAEVDRLKGIDKNKVVKLELSPEQEILEVQIMRLQQASRERSLTYDETRMLDLHIKNKRLLEDKSTINADYKTLPAEMSDDELLRIAESAESEEKTKTTKRSRTKSKTSS